MSKTYNRIKSKTIWGAIISAASPIIMFLTTNTACVNALAEVVDPKVIAGISSIVGMGLTIYGREDAEAKHKIAQDDAVREAEARIQDEYDEGNVY